ncbi:MAG: hypothetical protein FJX46_04365 [Alphaproteobacteria bacterium]|nr:hypothetical protein [Alphaproteobacteria bacterium]
MKKVLAALSVLLALSVAAPAVSYAQAGTPPSPVKKQQAKKAQPKQQQAKKAPAKKPQQAQAKKAPAKKGKGKPAA